MSSPIDLALRNKRTLEWLHKLPLITLDCNTLSRGKVMAAYARHLKCPLCELDYDMTQQDDLDYLYRNYWHLIEKT